MSWREISAAGSNVVALVPLTMPLAAAQLDIGRVPAARLSIVERPDA